MKGGVFMVWRVNRAKAELALMNSGKTWSEIARETKTSPVTIINALKGKSKTSLRTIGKMAAGLGVDAADIAENVEE